MEPEGMPQYMRIAAHIASRVDQGELAPGQRVSGRSVLSSEYGVSPETVRRALRLLADMKVVEIREKSGVVVLSADNARRYLQSVAGRTGTRGKRAMLRRLLEQQEEVSRQLSRLCEGLLDAQESPLPEEVGLPNYQVRVSPGSDKVGKSIGSLRFWQSTGATIVAIRRGKNLIVSPGPYLELYPGDQVFFVCESSCVPVVEGFLNGDGGPAPEIESTVK